MAFAGSQPFKLAGVTASADLSTTGQFLFVKMSGAKTVTICAAATDIPVGVLQNTPKSGQAAEVVVVGQTKITASAAITAGAQIGTTSGAKAVTLVAGTDTTKYVVGTAIETASANNDLIDAIVDCTAPARGA